jgi:hypothetical protein
MRVEEVSKNDDELSSEIKSEIIIKEEKFEEQSSI